MTPDKFPYPIVLGSGSPRRKALLTELGFSFRVQTMDTDESYPNDLSPVQIAEYLAKKKSVALRDSISDHEILITADTVVALGDALLEKAHGPEEAKGMLNQLSGNTHQVISGICVFHQGKEVLTHSLTEVTFKKLSSMEIDYYVDNYRPFDKAGAYGIQEWIGQIGVTRINGSYYNVVGLPTEKLWEILVELSR
jgi:septum formation protein